MDGWIHFYQKPVQFYKLFLFYNLTKTQTTISSQSFTFVFKSQILFSSLDTAAECVDTHTDTLLHFAGLLERWRLYYLGSETLLVTWSGTAARHRAARSSAQHQPAGSRFLPVSHSLLLSRGVSPACLPRYRLASPALTLLVPPPPSPHGWISLVQLQTVCLWMKSEEEETVSSESGVSALLSVASC